MPTPCTVTAQLNTIGAAASTDAFVRFKLRNYQGFEPRVLGTAVLVETQVDASPSGLGAVSQALWGNDSIDPTNTFYTVEWWSRGRILSSVNYIINGSVFDLNTAAIINPPDPPQSIATPILLETNGVENGNQYKQNLHSSDGSVTLTDDGVGNIDVKSTGGGGGAVSSVFGRTGSVTAQSGDYSYAEISGTPQLPQTETPVTHEWVRSYDATTGLFTKSQPAFSDVSGTSGLAQGGTGTDLSASGSSTAFLAQDGSHNVSARSLVAGDVPSLDASKLTTGTLALARGGTNADLSGTGGASQVLKQSSVGGAVTVGQLAASDLSNGAVGSGAVVLATSPTLVTPNIGVATAGGALNMSNNLINNVTDPSSPQDAATKQYVDSTIAGVNPGTTVSTTNDSYTAGQVRTYNLTMAKTFASWKVTEATGKAFWLRLYSTSAARTADASRPYSVPIQLGTQSGLILALYIDQVNSVTPFALTPAIVGSNVDSVQARTIYASVQSLETGTQNIQVTISYATLES